MGLPLRARWGLDNARGKATVAEPSLANPGCALHIGRHGRHGSFRKPLPSLIRFVVTLAVLAGLAYAGMFALATFVEPETREMKVRIPSAKLKDAR